MVGARRRTPGSSRHRDERGYLVIMLMMAVFAIGLGFLIALPVYRTEVKREKEEELIFRGKQYVEAVRLFILKNPGRFPASLDELLDKRCIRQLYKDPMTQSGEWNIILNPASAGVAGVGSGGETQVYVVPQKALSSVRQPAILGVVSSSKAPSVKIYNDQESYDKWLFYYGQDPKKLPKIIYYGEKIKTP